MDPVKIIGLCGFAGCGKDTIGALLPGYSRLAFADELKRRAAASLGITVEYLEQHKREIRPLLVALGATGRLLDPLVWVKPVLAEIERRPNRPYYIPDVRYINERNMIVKAGGAVVYIRRNGVVAANDEEGRTVPEVEAVADVVVGNVEDHPSLAADAICRLFCIHGTR